MPLLCYFNLQNVPYKSHNSGAARALFILNAHCRLVFSLLDEKEVHLMGQCSPGCRSKFNMNSHCCLIGTAYPNVENDHRHKINLVWKFHKYLHIIKYKMYLTSLSVTYLYYKTQIQYDIVQQPLLTRYLTLHVQCHKNMHVQ